jgi:predicted small lipoprotein YifL
MRSTRITIALASLALALAACGEKEEGPFPLDAAAVKAAVDRKAGVTSFCEGDELALEPDESVTCPAATRTRKGPLQGDLTVTREGEATDEVTYELSLSGPGGNRIGGGQARLEPVPTAG